VGLHGTGRMEPAVIVRALETLNSPLEWGGQDAWLAESLRRVREVLGVDASPMGDSPVGELELLLRLRGDEPGWLAAALASVGLHEQRTVLPTPAVDADDFLVVSLRCALGAGMAALERQHAWRRMLARVFDGVATGMAILTSEGLREVVRNARWDQLLREEPGRDRLRAIIAQQAARAAASAEGVGEHDLEVDLPGGSYRLVATRMAAGTLLPQSAVLVLVDRPGLELPTTQELRVTFGFRGREPQVALLAAEGLSNADIARQLRLSAHTVRHYLERVLERLGVHSRKALALRLMVSPPGQGARGPVRAREGDEGYGDFSVER
jgi:DNA-binding CsgD family transcriptional regulator